MNQTVNTHTSKSVSSSKHQKNQKQTTMKTSVLSVLQNTPLPEDFGTLTGPLDFLMTNDMLFHIVFEADPYALTGLICSLLHLKPEEITSIEVTNPIELGNSVYSKRFVLDLRLLLNGTGVLNLEMQVENLKFWKERSVGYLCRAFDNLNKGESYLQVQPAIHVGILDFDLFPQQPEFYATYHLSNDLTHKKYSDKLRLSVLQLRHTDLATKEDRLWQLDLWAKFFKANTWEVIHMLAEKNPHIASAARTVYRVTQEDYIRNMLEAREEGEKTQRTIELLHQMEIQERDEAILQKDELIKQKDASIKQMDESIKLKDEVIEQKDASIKQKDESIKLKDEAIKKQSEELSAAYAKIAELEAKLK